MLKHLKFKPGIDTQSTALANSDQWTASSLIRFRNGWAEMLTGFSKLCQTALAGTCRALHHWTDLDKKEWLAAGTNSNLYLIDESNIRKDITPTASFTAGSVSGTSGKLFSLANWTLDNFGERLIATPSGQGIFLWQPPDTTVKAALITQAPPHNQGAMIVMPSRIIMAYGSAPLAGTQDPLLIRWCDQEDYTDWIVATTNLAGSFRLSRGSIIVGGCQAGSTILLFTDIDLWISQFIGYPLVFSFVLASAQCGLIGQHAFAVFGGSVFWLSDDGFFQYSGSGVSKLPCSVWDVVFKNLDRTHRDKCVSGIDGKNSEIWFFFPSKDQNTGEIDSYVKYNIIEKVWDYGSASSSGANIMARTAWTDRDGLSVNVDLSGYVQIADDSFLADGAPMTDGMVQSGYVDVSEGSQALFVDQFIPDFMWDGDNPEISITLYFRDYPGNSPTALGPFSITPTTRYVTLRLPRTITIGGTTITAWPAIRAREVAIQIQTVSGWWRFGAPRLRIATSGTQP